MSSPSHNYSGKFTNDFPYSRDARKDYIKNFDRSKPISTGYKIPSEDGLHDVYSLEIKFLIYNFENGRYLTQKLTREKQIGRDVFLDESNLNRATTEIEQILWDENAAQNEDTIDDLLRNGQEVPGVVDASGIVVSGNRRLRLLHEIQRRRDAGEYASDSVSQQRLDELSNFKAVIIDKELSPQEINDYESRLQYGEKRKLDYDPIEKYFIVRRLKNDDHWTDDKILANNKEMPLLKSPKDIERFIRISILMEEYLTSIASTGIYTLLKDAEDMFIQLDESIMKMRNGTLQIMRPIGNLDLEIQKFKIVFFTLIRDRDVTSGKKYYRGLIKIYAEDVSSWNNLVAVSQGLTSAPVSNDEADTSLTTTDRVKEQEQTWQNETGNKLKEPLDKAFNSLQREEIFKEPEEILGEVYKDTDRIKKRLSSPEGSSIVTAHSQQIRELIYKIEANLNHILNKLDV